VTDKVTVPKLSKYVEKGQKIVCVTAYDEPTARLADEAGVDVILVGDSVGSVVYGYSTTIPVSLDDIVRHTQAAARGCKRAHLISDLPFGSYQISLADAVESSVILAKAGAESVKLEGLYTDEIEAIIKAGIPVMGHLGMTPQSYNNFGGHRVQGRGDAAQKLIEDALRLEDSGAYAIVLELVPASVAKRVSDALTIPTIGIGAGVDCDGQIQVFHDLIGLSTKSFKHAKRYAEAGDLIRSGIASYVADVKSSAFPTAENSFEDH
jgi:3-methyl-2-oxobutanoate hydroxymethyltransferase